MDSENDLESVTYDRSFITLLVDGVELLIASQNKSNENISDSLARCSLVCTMMMPEVAANILIETLGLESSVWSDVDRMSTIGKFDFFLRTTFRKRKLNRGTKELQGLKELKQLRDSFVHPKPQRVVWSLSAEGLDLGSSDRTPLLAMSKNPSMWCVEDAVKGMRAVHAFLSHYFKFICKYSKMQSSNLLFSTDEEAGARLRKIEYSFGDEFDDAIQKWSIDLSYLNIRCI